ncbi:hypothetical protein BKA58DRAFT_429530 [Alternaria rosae]|uniref:uncharacterized protein n=1 Tax=Alternaria rosae TaxID=1187941 RepID=UPI001E8E0E22|nr:uncharacterized protein BKA58DRAFT_429530 [Alternaria rosae]KAH6870402.1 hypothetical protein BKA58DRAFT_429530 [Alternaria rosae]
MEPSTHVAPPASPTLELSDEKEPPALAQPTSGEIVPHGPFHDLIPGYPKLAGRMGIMPEIGMFRRFGALNARSLLYYQDELAYLEDQLKEVGAEDAKSSEGMKSIIADDALIQQSSILQSMNEPNAFDLIYIQHFLTSDQMRVIPGPEQIIWGSFDRPKDFSGELVVLRGQKEMDPFSRNMGARAVDWIVKLGGKRWKKVDARFGTVAIDEDTVNMFTCWITSAVASILLVGPIFILANTESLDAQLATIAASNVLTSVCLMYFTRARRTDEFAITAA